MLILYFDVNDRFIGFRIIDLFILIWLTSRIGNQMQSIVDEP